MKKVFLMALALIGLLGQAQNQPLINYCGNMIFDLSQASTQFVGNQNPADFNISYHLTQSDAATNSNAIENITTYSVTSSQQLLFVRVENTVNSNLTIFPLQLIVNPNLEVTLSAVLNTPTSTVSAILVGGQAPYTYIWSINGGAAVTTTEATFNFTSPVGTNTISVNVTDATGCTGSAVITVTNQQTIVANDDSFAFSNPVGIEPPGLNPVLFNDRLNGLPATLTNVTITVISASDPNIGIGFEGGVYANPQTPSGTHTLIYQICEIGNPNNCDTATVTLNVQYCRANTPVVQSIVQPLCDSSEGGTVVLTGLPDIGQWMLTVQQGTGITYYNGQGTTYTLSNLQAGNYSVMVRGEDILLSNCYDSFPVAFVINQDNGISLEMQGTYNDTNANGLTDLGDTIEYGFAVTNHACIDATDANVSSNEVSVSGNPFTLPAGQTNNTAYSGLHILTQEDINSGVVFKRAMASANYGIDNYIARDSVSVNLNVPNGIKFNAFLDHNSNGIQDNAEPNFTAVSFYYLINGGPTHFVYNTTGIHYLYDNSSTNFYNIGCHLLTQSSGCQQNYTLTTVAYNNITIAPGSGLVTYNFPITIASNCNDLSIYIYSSSGLPRPGFVYQNTITYRNNSSQTIASGTVTFTKDDALSIISISETGTTPTSSGFTYDFANLLPNETRFITVAMQVPTIPTISLGDLLTNTASISLLPNEINEYNNSYTLAQVVVGSYDPNDKTEAHGGKIVHSGFTANDYLTYTIRFENTGTAEAINVKVDDVLDAQLDETSVQMIKASHNYVLDRVGSSLSWRFDGIGLPPSVEGDDVTGHGYIVFQVKPKPGFVIGDVIPNSADIYFDFNPAIVTNTCTTEFVPFLGIDAFENGSFDCYPNPTSSVVTFSSKAAPIESLEITDVSGKTLISKSIQNSEATIDLSNLNPGIYFAKLRSGTQEKTVKLIRK
ncbi:T9SS type A sorting domain-containing protein [Flavobacterium sp. CYK-4]|uniref:T9SS type A sorting domain-containing protein n=1 Tax=Flavobacterium lotistagni TaxID=2709660 RepID=UPI00140AE9AA|nr:T9SS type A sorting domain-containing protein [Flavobacterium lotistagni]NHM06652.1 T9SS type A sorting domain-containing protein [Flavobacterium lotistagni]